MKKSTQTPTSIVYKTGDTPVRYTPFKETKGYRKYIRKLHDRYCVAGLRATLSNVLTFLRQKDIEITPERLARMADLIENTLSKTEPCQINVPMSDEEVNGVYASIRDIWVTSESQRDAINRLRFLFKEPKD